MWVCLFDLTNNLSLLKKIMQFKLAMTIKSSLENPLTFKKSPNFMATTDADELNLLSKIIYTLN